MSDRLQVIEQTLADLEKLGHNCDWGREADLKWCINEIHGLRVQLRCAQAWIERALCSVDS